MSILTPTTSKNDLNLFYRENDSEYQHLRSLGYTGAVGDMQRAYLSAQGYTGSISDMRASVWLSDPRASYVRENNTPPLVADFNAGVYGVDGSNKVLTDVVPSFTRASTGTYINSSNLLVAAAVDEIRVGYNPITGLKGMLIEPAATNLVVTPTAPVDQTITVADLTDYTLHFTGTGSITLTGASTSGPLVGTGAGEDNRVSLTFTTAGTSLTLTLSGTVVNTQLELGSVATSFVDGVRSRDIPTIPTSAFGYADGAAGTWIADYTPRGGGDLQAFEVHDGTTNTRTGVYYRNATTASRLLVRTAGTYEVILDSGVAVGPVRQRVASAIAANDAAVSFNGGVVKPDTTVIMATGHIAVAYGSLFNTYGQLNGWLHSLVYHDTKLTDSELVSASTL